MSSSQLTFIFFRGVAQPPTSLIRSSYLFLFSSGDHPQLRPPLAAPLRPAPLRQASAPGALWAQRSGPGHHSLHAVATWRNGRMWGFKWNILWQWVWNGQYIYIYPYEPSISGAPKFAKLVNITPIIYGLCWVIKQLITRGATTNSYHFGMV